jgi:hypothetical protein
MKGWRTIFLNLGVTAFGVLEATDWTAVLGNDKAGWMVTTIGVANMILRAFTTTPFGRST